MQDNKGKRHEGRQVGPCHGCVGDMLWQSAGLNISFENHRTQSSAFVDNDVMMEACVTGREVDTIRIRHVVLL